MYIIIRGDDVCIKECTFVFGYFLFLFLSFTVYLVCSAAVVGNKVSILFCGAREIS